MPAPVPIVNSHRLGNIKQAISQIPGSANVLMIFPTEMSPVPITNSFSVGPSGEVFYTITGYFDFTTLTFTAA